MSITNCYATGKAQAVSETGTGYASAFVDLIGHWQECENCFGVGQLTADTKAGFVRSITSGTVTNCFWDIQTTGTSTSDGGTGKTTAQMKTMATFAGWNIGASTTDLNNGYPYLGWQLGNSPTWYILEDSILPVNTDVQIVLLEALRNIEMSAMGRIYVDEEGNLCYENRYARQL